eukprot:COSAG04_NODE_497_length_13410_cov_6.004658_1_plen_160_part_00
MNFSIFTRRPLRCARGGDPRPPPFLPTMVRTDSLEGQVAIVTGGAAGIGGACSSLLAEVGARVLVVDLEAPLHGLAGPEAKAAEIRAVGGQAEGFAADISQDAEIEAMVDRAVELWGRLDILVNSKSPPPPAPQHPILYPRREAFRHGDAQTPTARAPS